VGQKVSLKSITKILYTSNNLALIRHRVLTTASTWPGSRWCFLYYTIAPAS